MKILYIHGFMGHANGSASKLLRAELDRRNIMYTLDAPEFPITEISEMRRELAVITVHKKYDYIVSSSLGAFYLITYPGKGHVLINPALPENLRKLRNESPGASARLTDGFIDKIEEIHEVYISNHLDEKAIENTYFVYGTKDNIAPNEEKFKRYYNDESRIFHCDMGHKLNEAGAVTVCDIIERLERDRKTN